mmetsp:Transcript_11282/g.16942  ORF Transcript_11282/g.16942 Transcript_11282/m.16942 type:complete len:232 (-) Transcript_11282:98-793(-)
MEGEGVTNEGNEDAESRFSSSSSALLLVGEFFNSICTSGLSAALLLIGTLSNCMSCTHNSDTTPASSTLVGGISNSISSTPTPGSESLSVELWSAGNAGFLGVSLLVNNFMNCAPNFGFLTASLDNFFAFASAGLGANEATLSMDDLDDLLTFTGVGTADFVATALLMDDLDGRLALFVTGVEVVVAAAAAAAFFFFFPQSPPFIAAACFRRSIACSCLRWMENFCAWLLI